MNITINEPCHENWDAMTPNQQGAFCKSCQKSVIDFSKKTIEEIKDFFSKPQEGKVCGRFESTQLKELSFDDFFARFRYWNFSKKMAVIFFMAFGFSLFSNDVAAQSSKHMLKGEVAYFEPVKAMQKDTAKKQVKQPENNTKHVIMGKIKCTKPEPTQEDKKEKEPKKTMGQVIKIDPVKEEKDPKVKTVDAVPLNNIKEEHMVMGMIVSRPVAPVIDPEIKSPDVINTKPVIQVVEDKVQVPTEKKTSDATIVVYPNPNSGSFTVQTKEKHALHILDATGKVVLTQAINGNTAVNAEHVQPGTYFVSLTGGSAPVVKKIIITR